MNKTIIIAEAGINHNGSLKKAFKLVDIAKLSGADYVKFQTFQVKDLVVESAKKAKYQLSKNKKETQFQMLKKNQLSHASFEKLFWYCKKKKINFLSAAFDIKSVDILHKIGLKVIKIPSGEITNIPLLEYIAKKNFEVILSTGMATIQEIKKAVNILKKTKKLSILHCNSAYPTPFKDANLNTIVFLSNRYKNLTVGYSDHTLGIEASLAAVALGAKIIEKHFTINKKLEGPDHRISLDPLELKKLVDGIRNIENAFGKKTKVITKSEKINIIPARKSIVAKKKITKGEKFSEFNLTTKRPQSGISSSSWYKIINKKSKYNFIKNDLIKL